MLLAYMNKLRVRAKDLEDKRPRIETKKGF